MLLRPTFTIGFQQFLKYLDRLLREAQLSPSFAFSEFGLEIIRVLLEDLSKRAEIA